MHFGVGVREVLVVEKRCLCEMREREQNKTGSLLWQPHPHPSEPPKGKESWNLKAPALANHSLGIHKPALYFRISIRYLYIHNRFFPSFPSLSNSNEFSTHLLREEGTA